MDRLRRAIFFADIAEYVRIIELDEEGTIQRWHGLLDLAERTFLQGYRGRIIKKLGDGVLIAFEDARSAVAAATAFHDLAAAENRTLSQDRKLMLRIGIDYDTVIMQSEDMVGRAVNRAARLMSLASPGETILSARARDGVSDVLDGRIEDLGECYLRHVAQPVRAFRVTSDVDDAHLPVVASDVKLQPVLAVIPFQPLIDTNSVERIGDVLSEEIIRSVSRSDEIAVISRLSTVALSARSLTVGEIAGHLGADYILSGVYRVDGDRIVIDVEMAESAYATIIWAERFNVDKRAILSPLASPCAEISMGLFAAITLHELSLSRKRPLPTLESYTLLLSAVELMHHFSQAHYQRSRSFLEELIQRGGHHAEPHAWLANWHVLRVIQGWSTDMKQDASLALRNSSAALDSDPDSELALAMDGFANLHLARRFDIAETRFDGALLNNPSCAIAHLLKGTMYAFSDRGEQAVAETEKALSLSPLDPHRFMFETHCAGAHLTAGNFERSAELAQRSRQSNRRHASTQRILTVSLWELGREEEARAAASELMLMEPELTKSAYLKRSPNADFAVGKRIADVLHLAGVPA